MIRNIVFDIGNVLTDFRWRGFLQDKGFQEEMVERIARASVMTPLWYEIDRGVWDEERLIREFIKLDPEIEEELRLAYGNVKGMVTKRDYAIPWLKELKERGYRLYYLSNFSHKAYVDCMEALDFLPLMDGGILSYQERVVKPDPEIYLRLLRQYDLKAEESVFLDDTPMNVTAAEELGFRGICFETREQAQKELEGYLAEK